MAFLSLALWKGFGPLYKGLSWVLSSSLVRSLEWP